MTDFHVDVVRIGAVVKHPNADRLELTSIHADENGNGGYPAIFGKGDFKEGDLAVYVPVDSVVPDNETWSFLWEGVLNPPVRKRRIKAKKLRGIFSMGVLTAAPAGAVVGQLGITKYEDPSESEHLGHSRQPKNNQRPLGFFAKLWRRALRFLGFATPNTSSQALYGCPPPDLKHLPGLYDLENVRRYGSSWLDVGEEIIVTEKIHGQNARFVHDGTKLHMKSRTVWRENDPTQPKNAWAKAAQKYNLERKLAAVPGLILYGEVYGNFADLPYGASDADPGFVAFDAFNSHTGEWLPWDVFIELCDSLEVPTVPVIYRGPFASVDALKPLAEGPSTMYFAPPQGSRKHLREGFVVKPTSGRNLPGGQRIVLKLHGEGFLTRKDADKPFDAKPLPVAAPWEQVHGRTMRPSQAAAEVTLHLALP